MPQKIYCSVCKQNRCVRVGACHAAGAKYSAAPPPRPVTRSYESAVAEGERIIKEMNEYLRAHGLS